MIWALSLFFKEFFLSPLVHGVVRQCSTKEKCPFKPCSVRTNEDGYVLSTCCCENDFCNSATNFGMNLFSLLLLPYVLPFKILDF